MMKTPFFLSGALALLAALGLQTAYAYQPTLSQADIQAAYNEGMALAKDADASYSLKAYLLYEQPDTLNLYPRYGAVDGVTIATPYERVRYAAYLHQIGDDPFPVSEARTQADLPDHQIDFTVFAHGMKPDDQDFLKAFGPATLIINGKTIRAIKTDPSEASVSTYPHTVNEIGIRFVGTITYRFALPDSLKNGKGTLNFRDASGKNYHLNVNLGKFR